MYWLYPSSEVKWTDFGSSGDLFGSKTFQRYGSLVVSSPTTVLAGAGSGPGDGTGELVCGPVRGSSGAGLARLFSKLELHVPEHWPSPKLAATGDTMLSVCDPGLCAAAVFRPVVGGGRQLQTSRMYCSRSHGVTVRLKSSHELGLVDEVDAAVEDGVAGGDAGRGALHGDWGDLAGRRAVLQVLQQPQHRVLLERRPQEASVRPGSGVRQVRVVSSRQVV